eukprot:scaffold43493_cov72-Phaeocystis_antarctica.AAC.1
METRELCAVEPVLGELHREVCRLEHRRAHVKGRDAKRSVGLHRRGALFCCVAQHTEIETLPSLYVGALHAQLFDLGPPHDVQCCCVLALGRVHVCHGTFNSGDILEVVLQQPRAD